MAFKSSVEFTLYQISPGALGSGIWEFFPAVLQFLKMHAQTRRQREVLDLIARYIDTHGYRPSYQVIARHLGLKSRAGIARIVHDLESQGLVTRRREEGHFYLDMNGGSETFAIHWLDVPNDDSEPHEWQKSPVWVPRIMIGDFLPDCLRAFLVPDNAMANENICEDDIALIEFRDFARDGQLVVALLNRKEAVLRKYYRSGAEVELRTADSRSDAIKLAADRIRIIGIYRGLLRPAT